MTKLDSCDIIRDLLPGYIDGVLSKTGTNAVKEHLEKCGECNRVYREMTEEMEIAPLVEEQVALDGFKKNPPAHTTAEMDRRWSLQPFGSPHSLCFSEGLRDRRAAGNSRSEYNRSFL